jgi:hypothetical protein
MAFATKSGLTALVALVQGISTIQGTVNRGTPESFPTLVSAYVAVGLPNLVRETSSGGRRLDGRYFIGFGYAVEGSEQDAEDDLADTIDEFIRELEADPTVGGVLAQAHLADPGPTTPDYATVVGQEYRHVRFTLETQQRETIALV